MRVWSSRCLLLDWVIAWRVLPSIATTALREQPCQPDAAERRQVAQQSRSHVARWQAHGHVCSIGDHDCRPLLDVVPAGLGGEINAGTVGGFIEHMYKLPLRLRDSLMVNRVRKALELFEKRNNNGEIASFLNAQSDIDANRSSGSYTLLKVFLWAIPILGFIGTVQGLSVAVSSLSTGSGDPEQLKNSINQLTGGLGVAFDTTLLGLVLSMIMSFPMAAMQKEEEEVLTLIDAFCNEKLLPKLNDSKSDASDMLLSQAENIPAFAASLARAHEVFLERLGEATRQLAKAGETLDRRLDAHQTTVEVGGCRPDALVIVRDGQDLRTAIALLQRDDFDALGAHLFEEVGVADHRARRHPAIELLEHGEKHECDHQPDSDLREPLIIHRGSFSQIPVKPDCKWRLRLQVCNAD